MKNNRMDGVISDSLGVNSVICDMTALFPIIDRK